MDFIESEEQRMMREAVAGIGRKYGHGYWVKKAHSGEKTTELWQALAEGGFLGVNIPESYGGSGGGIGNLAILCEELAAAGCPLLSIILSSGIGASLIARFGTEVQKAQWLPKMATGELRMAFALTEPDAGSNTHRLATTAKRDGDGWRLSGSKYFISAVDESQLLLVVAKTSADEANGRGKLSLFILDTDAEGLTKTPLPVEMVAPEKQFTLFFDEVRIPKERLLGVEGEGLRQLFHGLNPERITSAATSVGIARYALDKAASYARDRSVWGKPIGAHQGIAHPLAAAKVQMELARLMMQKAAWLCDSGGDAGSAANMAKYAAAEASLVTLDQAIQTHGGNGLSSEFGLMDYWGLARLLRTAPVSREMILNHIAQHDLGLPRSY